MVLVNAEAAPQLVKLIEERKAEFKIAAADHPRRRGWLRAVFRPFSRFLIIWNRIF